MPLLTRARCKLKRRRRSRRQSDLSIMVGYEAHSLTLTVDPCGCIAVCADQVVHCHRQKGSRDGFLGRRCFLGIRDRPGESAARGLGTGVEIIPLDRPLAGTGPNLGGEGRAGAGSESRPRATEAAGVPTRSNGRLEPATARGSSATCAPLGPPRRPAQSWISVSFPPRRSGRRWPGPPMRMSSPWLPIRLSLPSPPSSVSWITPALRREARTVSSPPSALTVSRSVSLVCR